MKSFFFLRSKHQFLKESSSTISLSSGSDPTTEEDSSSTLGTRFTCGEFLHFYTLDPLVAVAFPRMNGDDSDDEEDLSYEDTWSISYSTQSLFTTKDTDTSMSS